jgi:hypothetical protein
VSRGKRELAVGDVGRLRWPVRYPGRRGEAPAGALVTVVEIVQAKTSTQSQIVRCAVGEKSIVGHIEVTSGMIELMSDLQTFIYVIEHQRKNR